MKVSEVMAVEVHFLAPEASLQDAATLMGELEVGAMPVGSAEDLQGVITDRDILYRAVAEGRGPETRVREIMSPTVFTCRETDSLAAAMDLMGAYHIRRLPVMGEGGKVAGWITLSDISRRLLQEGGALRRVLDGISEREPVEAS